MSKPVGQDPTAGLDAYTKLTPQPGAKKSEGAGTWGRKSQVMKKEVLHDNANSIGAVTKQKMQAGELHVEEQLPPKALEPGTTLREIRATKEHNVKALSQMSSKQKEVADKIKALKDEKPSITALFSKEKKERKEEIKEELKPLEAQAKELENNITLAKSHIHAAEGLEAKFSPEMRAAQDMVDRLNGKSEARTKELESLRQNTQVCVEGGYKKGPTDVSQIEEGINGIVRFAETTTIIVNGNPVQKPTVEDASKRDRTQSVDTKEVSNRSRELLSKFQEHSGDKTLVPQENMAFERWQAWGKERNVQGDMNEKMKRFVRVCDQTLAFQGIYKEDLLKHYSFGANPNLLVTSSMPAGQQTITHVFDGENYEQRITLPVEVKNKAKQTVASFTVEYTVKFDHDLNVTNVTSQASDLKT